MVWYWPTIMTSPLISSPPSTRWITTVLSFCHKISHNRNTQPWLLAGSTKTYERRRRPNLLHIGLGRFSSFFQGYVWATMLWHFSNQKAWQIGKWTQCFPPWKTMTSYLESRQFKLWHGRRKWTCKPFSNATFLKWRLIYFNLLAC